MQKKKKNYFLENIKRFKDKQIFVVGDIMLDEYLWGNVDRISPEAPVPIVKIENETKAPGGASNVVNNLIGLGAKVYLSGVIGNDQSGEFLKKYFSKKDVDISGVVIRKDRATTVKTRVIAHDQQVVRVDKESVEPIHREVIDQILGSIKKIIKTIDGIIISDYGKGVIVPDLIEKLITLANDNKKVIAVDPKIEHFFQYKNVTLITPNHFEAEKVLNIKISDQEDVHKAGKQIMKELDLKYLFITQSKDGMTVFRKNKQPANIPTHARIVYDVTGAGDTVISTAVLALVSGLGYEEAAMLANYAAGIVVEEVGTTAITIEKLKRALLDE